MLCILKNQDARDKLRKKIQRVTAERHDGEFE